MTIYQEEMQRKAQHYGCITSYDESDQLLLISHKGVHLTAINPEGFMFYNSKDLTDPESREVFSHLVDDAETVREYVGLYESAPQMKPKDVQNYRKLSEYGDVVFAGMYSQKHGFMFCSWRQSDGGRYLAHGDYSPDYLSSKENFAVRAGLVDNNKLFTKEEAKELFTKEEAKELFKCAAFARDNCESLTYEQDRGLMELMEKLQTEYPHLMLKLHIGMGFEENTTEDNALNIQVRIAEIDAEFKAMLGGVSSDTVDAFDDEKASALIMEKTKLQKQLEQLQEIHQKRINTKHRLDDIYTILDGLKNRPMEYDDQMVRQILECVTVDSKEQITVIFIGGLKINQSLLDC